MYCDICETPTLIRLDWAFESGGLTARAAGPEGAPGGWGTEQESWEASEPVLPAQFTKGFVMAADFLFFKTGNSPVCCPLEREQATSGSLRCYFSSRCALAKLG